MRPIFILFIALIGTSGFSQGFFDITVVQRIDINFFDEDWDHQLDSLASLGIGTGSGTERILAEVYINGEFFDSCGVRYKGNSSMDTTSNKNPFNIDLNYTIPGQEYQGKDKIKLANCFTDPSMVREALTYEIANRYMDCPRANFVELYINDEYRGIYTNTESIDNEYLNQFYGSSSNPFFKCDPISFDIYGDNSNLAFQPDSMAYDTLYDMKSEFGLKALQDFTYELEFEPATIEDYLDVDRALWFLALSSAFVHNDGYTAFAHNFYFYQMPNGKWSIILWDVNMSFGGLLWNGTNLLPLGLPALQNQDPFLHEAAFDFRPLIAQLLSNPRYRKMYVAHYKTIMNENMSNGYYLERAETMQDLINEYVADEPYNPYTYAQFTSNLYDNVGFWFDLRPGLEELMEARDTYINGLTEFNYLQPTISAISHFPAEPEAYSTVSITGNIIDANAVQLAYRYNEFDSFIYVTMFDDGAHDDGAAGDGVYGASIPILGTNLDYYIYAENANAGKFSPVRAAYEYYTISPRKGLVINELSADNAPISPDEDGDFDDWIELYNNSDENIALMGYHLSDNADNLSKWTFPNVTIGPGEYLILWADSDSAHLSGLHTNFKLSAGGEILTLSDASEQVVDQIDFNEQFEDITYGRYPNGIGEFDYLTPTFNSENGLPVGIVEVSETDSQFALYPNPANENITVRYTTNQSQSIRIFSVNGQLIHTEVLSEIQSILIDISSLNPGMYFVVDEGGQLEKLIVY